jgi:hypothetical protein
MRDVQRGVNRVLQGHGSVLASGQPNAAATPALNILLGRAERIRTQRRHDKHKLCALHAPEVEVEVEVECIGLGLGAQALRSSPSR